MSTQNENAGSKSLMKKTKLELVDIILRKDDVEAKLRKEKADVELDFNKAKSMLDKKDNEITIFKHKNNEQEKIIAKQKSAIDDYVTYNTKFISRNKRLIGWLCGIAVVLCGLAVYTFCF